MQSKFKRNNRISYITPATTNTNALNITENVSGSIPNMKSSTYRTRNISMAYPATANMLDLMSTSGKKSSAVVKIE